MNEYKIMIHQEDIGRILLGFGFYSKIKIIKITLKLNKKDYVKLKTKIFIFNLKYKTNIKIIKGL